MKSQKVSYTFDADLSTNLKELYRQELCSTGDE